jgi:hypothetical protein
MKQEILAKLEEFKNDLLDLRKNVSAITGKTVSKVVTRNAADAIATKWVEELRSPLEHKFKLPDSVIQATSQHMKRLHVLSRPNNLKESYLETINAVLGKFNDKFILPIKQTAFNIETIVDLQKLIPSLPDPSESDYLQEAINCANSGFKRAAVVLCWCAGIDRIQKALIKIGLDQFNRTSTKLKAKTSGKFKSWNKEFSITTLAELQTVFDNDLIVVMEGMGLLDGNQAERLRTCFQYRNHSAHPGLAPIEEPHLVAFFSDINAIIFQNPVFKV